MGGDGGPSGKVMVNRDVSEGRMLSPGKTQERLVPTRTNSRFRGHPGMGMSFLGLKKLSKRRGLCQEQNEMEICPKLGGWCRALEAMVWA